MQKKTQERVCPPGEQLTMNIGMRVEGLVSKEEYPHLASHVLKNAMKEKVKREQNN